MGPLWPHVSDLGSQKIRVVLFCFVGGRMSRFFLSLSVGCGELICELGGGIAYCFGDCGGLT
jgi:hypothetical protein